jgi:spermidine synthase
VLTEHDGTYAIRLDGQGLMDSKATESERILGQMGTAGLAGKADARVLIGGLGLGFTLKSVLEHVSPAASVTVAELLQPVIDWNRTHLAELNGSALADPRVEVRRADVFEVIKSRPAGFDVILLDIDNGPTPMVQKSNAGVYTVAGLLRLGAALRPRGRAVVWSAGDDPAFEDRLRRAGFAVELVRAKRYPGARKTAVTLYVADKR